MKYLIFLFMSFSLSYGQIVHLSGTIKIESNDLRKSSLLSNRNLNNDEKTEGIRYAFISKIADNEYWVKNVEIKSKSGDIYSFNDVLMKNHMPLINQVTALYGYVLSYLPNTDAAEVYIADETGSKNSDAIFILLK